MDDIVGLIFSLAAIALFLFLCYALSKYLAKKVNSASNGKNIKLIERVPLMQDKGLVITKIGQQYYLMGYSTNSIEILKEIDKEELQLPPLSSTNGKASFFNILNAQIKSRWDLNIGDTKRNRGDYAADIDKEAVESATEEREKEK
jgi:flagellar biosynthetic protein FliO